MGCDIHSHAIDANGKTIEDGEWADGEPFGSRNYGVFAFLARVRNYSGVTPISEPRGLPDDVYPFDKDEWPFGDHSFSWLSVAELEAFDYDAIMVDRRSTEHFFRSDGSYAGSDGSYTLPENIGKLNTWREFLGDAFFKDVAELRRIGADRVAFGFDN